MNPILPAKQLIDSVHIRNEKSSLTSSSLCCMVYLNGYFCCSHSHHDLKAIAILLGKQRKFRKTFDAKSTDGDSDDILTRNEKLRISKNSAYDVFGKHT